jgi:hypothetical protein
LIDSSLPTLGPELISELVEKFDQDPQFSAVERSIGWLFKSHPKNEEVSSVLLKVVAVNSLYSTQIYAQYELAMHITSIGLDPLLENGFFEAVEAVAHVELGGKSKKLYSFASKYCSWHRPQVYPILDSVVKDVIWKYKDGIPTKFLKKDLDTYEGFRAALKALAVSYGLDQVNWKDLDKGLWMLGKAL